MTAGVCGHSLAQRNNKRAAGDYVTFIFGARGRAQPFAFDAPMQVVRSFQLVSGFQSPMTINHTDLLVEDAYPERLRKEYLNLMCSIRIALFQVLRIDAFRKVAFSLREK